MESDINVSGYLFSIFCLGKFLNKGSNKITEHRTIFQREIQNS